MFAMPDACSEADVAQLELERQLSAMRAAQTERDQRMGHELALKSALLEQAEVNATEATKRAALELREHKDRLSELEQQLSAALAAQTERDQRLAQLTDELALKSALHEQAEANPAEAMRRTGLEPREHADRLLAQTSLVEQKDAELVDMQAKLDELLLSRDQNVRALEQALQKATSRAADADERSNHAREQINQYETELAEVRAKLEAKESELEAVRLQLTDAGNGPTKSKSGADTLRALTAAGLVSTDEDRITRGLVDRIRAMEFEMASLRLGEKSSEVESRNEG
jgi:chromosome segregation ATPase